MSRVAAGLAFRMASGVALCWCLTGAVAVAGPPDPANSECPGPCIRVVGHDGVVGDPVGEYCVTIRDFNNVPVVNDLVRVEFAGCGVQLCADQLDAAVSVDCVAQTLSRRTDALGRACFRVIGNRQPGIDCTPGPPFPCVEVFSGGLGFICNLYAPTYDLVNEAGVGLSGSDLSEFLHLFLDCGVYLTALDYNCNSTSDGDDLAQWLGVFFGGRSAQGCPPAAKCP
jgi:hypothetical protein